MSSRCSHWAKLLYQSLLCLWNFDWITGKLQLPSMALFRWREKCLFAAWFDLIPIQSVSNIMFETPRAVLFIATCVNSLYIFLDGSASPPHSPGRSPIDIYLHQDQYLEFDFSKETFNIQSIYFSTILPLFQLNSHHPWSQHIFKRTTKIMTTTKPFSFVFVFVFVFVFLLLFTSVSSLTIPSIPQDPQIPLLSICNTDNPGTDLRNAHAALLARDRQDDKRLLLLHRRQESTSRPRLNIDLYMHFVTSKDQAAKYNPTLINTLTSNQVRGFWLMFRFFFFLFPLQLLNRDLISYHLSPLLSYRSRTPISSPPLPFPHLYNNLTKNLTNTHTQTRPTSSTKPSPRQTSPSPANLPPTPSTTNGPKTAHPPPRWKEPYDEASTTPSTSTSKPTSAPLPPPPAPPAPSSSEHAPSPLASHTTFPPHPAPHLHRHAPRPPRRCPRAATPSTAATSSPAPSPANRRPRTRTWEGITSAARPCMKSGIGWVSCILFRATPVGLGIRGIL